MHGRPRISELSLYSAQIAPVTRAARKTSYPKILLGDEPTGNLDQATGDGVLNALLDLVRHTGLAALIATHNLDLAPVSTASSPSKTGG
jgi:lipoprotein-releasing system ATP-binding protein